MNRAERRPVIPSRAQRQAQAQRRRIALFVSLGFLALVIVVAVALASRVPKTASQAPSFAHLAVGQKAPEFAVSTTHGPFDLAQAGGKPTLLEVFATWCPHCQRETGVLNALYGAYGTRANVVAVNGSAQGGLGEPGTAPTQPPASQADVIDFATKFGVKYPIAFDPGLDVASAYLQGGFPTIVLIGRSGTVQAIGSGEIAQSSLAKALAASLAGGKPNPTFGT